MDQPSEMSAAPPPLRIVRRRTIDLDEDAAGMVAAAHGKTGHARRGQDLLLGALAVLALAAAVILIVTIW